MGPIVIVSLLLQVRTPQETFAKIEETIQAANRLTVTFSGNVASPVDPNSSIKINGTLLVKNPGKARLDVTIEGAGKNGQKTYCSDGVQLSLTRNDASGARPLTKATPTHLRNRLDVVLARVGIPLSVLFAEEAQLFTGPDHSVTELREAIIASEFKAIDDGKGNPGISYKLQVVRGKWKSLSCILWYDERTLRPLKRIVRLSDELKADCEETYNTWDVDTEIPDTRFTLPPEK